jgi:hypothetical protein
MNRIILSLLGIGFSFLLLKYREQIGSAVGDPSWASKVGGIYNVVILCGILIFFWSVAYLTGTEQIFFSPILMFFPQGGAPVGGVPVSEL